MVNLRLCYALAGLIPALILPPCARSQITPAEIGQIRSLVSDRIEALTIFGGDYLMGGGTFHSTEHDRP
jgi:hypothetical protein